MTIRFAVLTVSDRSYKGLREDKSGPQLEDAIALSDWNVCETAICPDEIEKICTQLIEWCDNVQIDVILTTGGTGFAPRDVTPEATRKVIEREAPGLAEAMRSESLKITPHAMLSRGIAGIRGRTLIINLPGSPRAALENFEVIKPVLPHAAALICDDPDAEQNHRMDSAPKERR